MAIDERRLDHAYAHLVAAVRKALVAVEAAEPPRGGDDEAQAQLDVTREVRAHLQIAAAALGRECPERRGPIADLAARDYEGISPEDVLDEAARRRAAHDLCSSLAGARPADFDPPVDDRRA